MREHLHVDVAGSEGIGILLKVERRNHVRRCSLLPVAFTPLYLVMWPSRRRSRECRRNVEVHPSRLIVPMDVIYAGRQGNYSMF
jgi:hypothetical protein